MPLYNPFPDLAAFLASKMSGSVPPTESTSGAAGSTALLPDAGHSHPRITSSTQATIAAGSTANVTFTRTFTKMPGIYCTLLETDSAGQQPCLFAVTDFLAPSTGASLGLNVADGTPIGGCTVKAWRTQTVPQNLATLLLSAVYSIVGGSVSGIKFTCIAVASSAP